MERDGVVAEVPAVAPEGRDPNLRIVDRVFEGAGRVEEMLEGPGLDRIEVVPGAERGRGHAGAYPSTRYHERSGSAIRPPPDPP